MVIAVYDEYNQMSLNYTLEMVRMVNFMEYIFYHSKRI
jgi:hypothetical protein